MAELFLPLLAQRNGIPELQIGIFSTANTLAMILMMIPAGIAADMLKQKKGLLGIATLIQTLVQFLFPLMQTPLGFLMISVLQGTALALYTPAVLALVTSDASIQTAGRYVGVYAGIFSAGMSMGSYFGGILADLVSLDFAYLFFGVTVLGSIALLLVPTSQPQDIPRHGTIREQLLNEARKLFGGSSRALRPLYVGILLRAIGFFSFYFYFPLYVTQLGLPNSLLGAADAINNATSFFAVIVLGYVVHRVSAKTLLLIGFYGHVFLTVLFAFVTIAVQLFLVMIFAGIIWAAMKIGALTLITQQTTSSERGKQNSLESSSYNAGRIIGSPINGALIQLGNGFILSYWFTGFMCLAGSLFLQFKLQPTKTQDLVD
jgi:MFS family permease